MKIEHIALWTRDLERLRVFYERYFSAKTGPLYCHAQHDFSSYFLTFDNGTRLELMQMPSIPIASNNAERQHLGYIHIAVSVGSETAVARLTKQLREDGYRVVGEPRRTGDGYYESIILDPDGNRIELTV